MKQDELFKHAKEDMLKDGEHAPILYVEYVKDGKDCMDMYYFADFGAETPTEEKMQIFDLGARFGKENGTVEFSCLTFIAEAWVSHVKPGSKPGFKRPADDPNRKEYLVAQVVQVMPTPDGGKHMNQSIQRAEIIRPTPDIVDLRQEPDDSEVKITSMLFPAYFISGSISSQLSKEELSSVVGQALSAAMQDWKEENK